jgi:hypothetical protein
MAKAVKRSGEIWLSMAKDVIVEPGRKMKSIGAQGEMSTVELAKPKMNEEGEVEMENDLSEAEFDVDVQVGPSSGSKRAATVRALTGMMAITQDPETMQVLGAMAMMNMEGEGIGEAREFFRQRLVKMGVMKPTEEEAAAMAEAAANAPQDPNAVFLQAAAEEAVAKAAQARANSVLTVAKTEETRAKTIETLSKVDASAQQQAIEAAQFIGQNMQQTPPQPQELQPQPME